MTTTNPNLAPIEENREVARPANLTEVVSLVASQSPGEIALRIWDYEKPADVILWGDLWSESCAWAERLRDCGMPAGSRVLIILPTSRFFISSFFGVLLAGSVAVPIAPPSTLKGPRFFAQAEHVNRIAQDCGAAACIAHSRVTAVLHDVLRQLGTQIKYFPADLPLSFNYRAVSGDLSAATALVQYTSGSTDRPKGVELSHENVLANLHAIAQAVAGKDSSGFSWLPLHHDMGLIGGLLTALYARRPMVLMPPQTFVKAPSLWLRGISEHRATVTMAPNFAFDYCTNSISPADLDGIDLGSLVTVLNGAEPVDADSVARFEARFRPLGLRQGAIRPVYGLAENCLAVTFSAPGNIRVDCVDAEALEARDQAMPAFDSARSRRIVSVGRPIGNQQVRIVDERDRPLHEREIGEIVVQGPSVMKGYFGKSVESTVALRGGWLHTGDLGYIAEGELFVSGRHKDIIIRHGRNYYPQDLEAQVGGIEGVFRDGIAAFSVEESDLTQVVIVAEARNGAESGEDITHKIRQRLHLHFLFGPDDIVLVRRGVLPRTTSGKIKRHECRHLYVSGEIRRFELVPGRQTVPQEVADATQGSLPLSRGADGSD